MEKSLNTFYEEYKVRHNGKPKHDYSHFIKVMSMIIFHRTMIRPKIKWWENT